PAATTTRSRLFGESFRDCWRSPASTAAGRPGVGVFWGGGETNTSRAGTGPTHPVPAAASCLHVDLLTKAGLGHSQIGAVHEAVALAIALDVDGVSDLEDRSGRARRGVRTLADLPAVLPSLQRRWSRSLPRRIAAAGGCLVGGCLVGVSPGLCDAGLC